MQPCSCMPLFSFPMAHWPSINDEMEAPGSPCLCSNKNILVFAPKSCYSGGPRKVAMQAHPRRIPQVATLSRTQDLVKPVSQQELRKTVPCFLAALMATGALTAKSFGIPSLAAFHRSA